MTLILASASASRARMLTAAGVAFATDPADLDEAALLRHGAGAEEAALAMAEAKALCISGRHPGKVVLGADSVLAFKGELIGKSGDLAAAKALLLKLSGRRHRIVSAAALARDGRIVWRHVGEGRLWMRELNEAFLDAYLAAESPAILASVGCYHLEERGAQLFDRIEGDFFSIIGLPLLDVLAALREQGVLKA